MLGEVRLRNWRRRSKMIRYLGITEGGDQGWSTAVALLKTETRDDLLSKLFYTKLKPLGRGDPMMAGSIRATETEVSPGREAVSRMAPKWQRRLVAWIRVMILCGSGFDHYKCPRSFACRNLSEKSQKSRVGWWSLNALDSPGYWRKGGSGH